MPRGHYEGTCPFKHSGPCWSNANFHGDISLRAWDDKPALARCEARRQAHARKINVTYKPLRAPKKKGPPPKDRRKALAAAAAVKAAVSEASLLADPFVGIGVADRGFDGALGFAHISRDQDSWGCLEEKSLRVPRGKSIFLRAL